MNKQGVPFLWRGSNWSKRRTIYTTVIAISAAAAALHFGTEAGGHQSVERAVATVAVESGAVTTEFLRVPEAAGSLVATSIGDRESSNLDSRKLYADMLQALPNVDAIYVGFPNGEFEFVANWYEDPEQGRIGYRSRLIAETAEGDRVARSEWFDDTFAPSTEPAMVEAADYDPRERSWYIAAMTQGEPSWSSPYIFFSSQQVGVSFSIPVFDHAGQLTAVVGIDVRLSDFIEFLEGRQPTPNSLAFVIDTDGQVLVASDMDTGTEFDASIDTEIRALALSAPIADDAAHSPVTSAFDIDGSTTAAAVIPLGTEAQWFLAIQTPENEFLADALATNDFRARLTAGAMAAAAAMSAVIAASLFFYVQALRRAALVDPLTNVASRLSITQAAERLLQRSPDTAGVAVIDLDGFKEINDRFGHNVGDAALQEVARRITAVMTKPRHVGRLGGDEFLVLADRSDDGLADLQLLLHELNAPMIFEDRLLELGASIGVAWQADVPIADLSSLLSAADSALYEAKGSGGGRVIEFDGSAPAVQDDASRRRNLVQAIEANELTLHFQPEVDLRTSTITSAEALLRWDGASVDYPLEAASFINDLERFGLIHMVLPHILGDACRFLEANGRPGFCLRLNLSAEQLLDPLLCDQFAEAQRRCPESVFGIEIDEAALRELSATAAANLRRLHEQRVMVTVDNYGVGGLSLIDLCELPIDAVKLHQSILDPESLEQQPQLISSIIDLARALGLEVAAKGIERVEQKDALLQAGATLGQGHLYSAAQPAPEFGLLVQPATRRPVLHIG